MIVLKFSIVVFVITAGRYCCLITSLRAVVSVVVIRSVGL